MRPKALPGDKILMFNPRTYKSEDATVTHTETQWGPRGYRHYHNYRVELDRRSKVGNRIFLWIGDNGIIKRYRGK